MAESAVVDFLRTQGWRYAERRSLNGALDKGDITGIPGLCMEVKYANSGLKLGPWLTETGIERINSGADYGILIVKPAGLGVKNIESWYTVMVATEFNGLKLLAHMESLAQFQAHGIVPLSIVDGPVTKYTAATLRHSLGVGTANLLTAEILALTLRPPGTKDRPEAWYRVMKLEHMVRLLHAAGYGDGPPYTREQWLRTQSPGATERE
jgi:hypothetical protein